MTPLPIGSIKTLEGERIDCAHAVRVPGGATSVSLIMLDAAGEKMIATRRGRELTEIAPADAAQAVADVDCVLLDNRYPEFCMPIAEAAQAARHSARARFRLGRARRRSAARGLHAM